jgi:hemerythrin
LRYELTDELRTGNAMVDREHQQLFDALNNLMDACSGGKGRAEIARTVRFLREYTETHFAHEEALQLRSGYPDFIAHQRLHDGFKRTVADLEKKLNDQGPTIALLGEVNSSIAGWLVGHIRSCDKKMCQYIRDHPKAS